MEKQIRPLTELTFRKTELTFSSLEIDCNENMQKQMDRSDIYWIEVTFTGQKLLFFLTQDRTVFFVIFIGQKCRFPLNILLLKISLSENLFC